MQCPKPAGLFAQVAGGSATGSESFISARAKIAEGAVLKNSFPDRGGKPE
jgi:hypothetical protein